MITLIILSLLVVVAVSYLSSMSVERQTADAYSAKARAEQAAQAGVESATAILAEAFRDFPDSATVWDTHQSTNNGSPANPAIYRGTDNEGATLYLRAKPRNASVNGASTTVPDPQFPSANDAGGNDPSNPACETFVLPLISGVPGGQAQLVSAKASILPAMNLGEPDPTKQNWAELNARRFNGDLQGFIGSPPDWATSGTPVAPKPARAFWVNVKGSDSRLGSRYAFWIDDESFKVNASLAGPPASTAATAGPPTAPPDNNARAVDSSGTVRSWQPSDLMLVGSLTKAADPNPLVDAGSIVNARLNYPGSFFPDPLAFSHAFDTATQPLDASTTKVIDALRYVTTNQSGALNLTRHGSQRLNLKTLIPPAAATPPVTVIQTQIDQLVQTLEFHLPYFGERFYRTNLGALNDATQVPGSPKAPAASPGSDNSQIYYYKVAANIRDYVDTDSQPTIIMAGGQVAPQAQPTGPLEDPGDASPQPNDFWAQGKESAPFIQEAAVRYRPVVTTAGNATSSMPKGHYDLTVDYYVEFWNMTDRDIYAAPQSNPALPNLGNATLFVRYQQSWTGYEAGNLLQSDYSTMGETLRDTPYIPHDWQIDLTSAISDGNGVAQDGTGGKPLGVVFRAGAVTVITTDPDFKAFTYKESAPGGSGPGNFPSAGVANLQNLYYCPSPFKAGQRHYSGKITDTRGATTVDGGLMLGGEFNSRNYSDTEISLVNSLGYIDVVRGAITKTNGPGMNFYTNTYKFVGQQGSYNDYDFGSSLMGNSANGGTAATPSEMGDPRTNNEQLSIWINNPSAADGSHFLGGSTRTLGSPNYPQVQPASTAAANQAWPDYYIFPSGASHPNPDATTAPAVVAGASSTDVPLTSVGQLGDVFDPARQVGTGGIAFSRGGGRTFKIGQHDDLYSGDPTTNVYAGGASNNNAADNVPASNGWASWRLADIFDVADAVELPARININGVQRDKGAALLSLLQGWQFQPTTTVSTDGTGKPSTPATTDPVVHGDGHVSGSSALAKQTLDTTGTTNGFSQLVAQMTTRLNNATPSSGPSGPFFERGELGELGSGTTALFGGNPTASSSANTALVATADMNQTFDHGREELFRRLAQMICTRGDTFTVYAVGQSLAQTTTASQVKITGTRRMRVTFRLVPQAKDPTTGLYSDFHPAYYTNNNADASVAGPNVIDTTNPSAPLSTATHKEGVNVRFAKPDRYATQILQVVNY